MTPSRSSGKVRLALVGLSHDHVNWMLRSLERKDTEVVGFYEPDRTLGERYAARFGFSTARLYTDLDAMLEAVQP